MHEDDQGRCFDRKKRLRVLLTATDWLVRRGSELGWMGGPKGKELNGLLEGH